MLRTYGEGCTQCQSPVQHSRKERIYYNYRTNQSGAATKNSAHPTPSISLPTQKTFEIKKIISNFASLIKRGGGTGPMKPKQPFKFSQFGKGAKSCRKISER